MKEKMYKTDVFPAPTTHLDGYKGAQLKCPDLKSEREEEDSFRTLESPLYDENQFDHVDVVQSSPFGYTVYKRVPLKNSGKTFRAPELPSVADYKKQKDSELLKIACSGDNSLTFGIPLSDIEEREIFMKRIYSSCYSDSYSNIKDFAPENVNYTFEDTLRKKKLDSPLKSKPPLPPHIYPALNTWQVKQTKVIPSINRKNAPVFKDEDKFPREIDKQTIMQLLEAQEKNVLGYTYTLNSSHSGAKRNYPPYPKSHSDISKAAVPWHQPHKMTITRSLQKLNQGV